MEEQDRHLLQRILSTMSLPSFGRTRTIGLAPDLASESFKAVGVDEQLSALQFVQRVKESTIENGDVLDGFRGGFAAGVGAAAGCVWLDSEHWQS